MNEAQFQFSSTEEWLRLGVMPQGEEAHPMIDKESVLILAEECAIHDPNDIHIYWFQLARAARDYEQYVGVKFNDLPKKIADETGDLLKKLGKLHSQLSSTSEEAFAHFESAAIQIRNIQLDVSGVEALPIQIAGTDELSRISSPRSIKHFTSEVAAVIAFLEQAQEFAQPAKRGTPPAFGLKLFVRRMLGFWRDTLGRSVTVDHNWAYATSDASNFIAQSLKLVDVVKDESVNSAVRAWRADNK
ncbi:hypothetical protein [uncultured Maricaulis sp.]|uniref:hypothetical protein n=1 Tax=uncultured Maricaulis sp. TaxID=174710 RepID=UPI0030DB325E|tara:strand:- start:7388 stop:8122 length:735 start_codon:yes stop_codon:yes gene_type:complete